MYCVKVFTSDFAVYMYVLFWMQVRTSTVCVLRCVYTSIFYAGQKKASERYLHISNVSQNTVGQLQDVVCSISIPFNVDPNTVELGWLNEDDITNDSRVIIIKSQNGTSNFSTSVMTTAIRFNPLFEDDEKAYSCYSVVNESINLASINLQNFTGK